MQPILVFGKDFPAVYIFEIKSNGVDCNAPKSHKYQWFIIRDGNMSPLNFEKRYESDKFSFLSFSGASLAWDTITGEAEFMDKSTGEVIRKLQRIDTSTNPR